MRSPHNEDFFPERLPRWTIGLAGIAIACSVCLALIFRGHVDWAWLPLYLNLSFWSVVATLFALARHRRGFRVERDGLRLLFWTRGDVVHPWSSMRALGVNDRGVFVRLSEGGFRFGSQVRRWRELVERIQQATGLDTGQGAGGEDDVDPAEVERWLGVEPGGALVCRGRVPWFYLSFSLAWVAGLVAAIPPASAGGAAAAALLVALACAGPFAVTFAWFAVRCWPRVTLRAHGEGVSIRDKRRRWTLGWSEILDIRQVRTRSQDHFYLSQAEWDADYDHLIQTPSMEYRFHRGLIGADKLAEAMRNVSAALAAGRAVPRMSDVPEGAISLARDGGEERAERGVSLASRSTP